MTLVVRLFLAGDVMIGRGIDQVLEHSVDPVLYERYVDSAETYVQLAERLNGPVPRPVAAWYPWGEALATIGELAPDARVVNLETTLTTSAAAWLDKPVLYRAHPANVAVLEAARLDCVTLANNHALDWGDAGLRATLDTLKSARIGVAGAGRSLAEARAPAVIDRPAGRVIVFAFGSTNSGIPAEWAAGADSVGLAVVDGWSIGDVTWLGEAIDAIRLPTDIVVASVHWGSNWGYRVPDGQRRLAHALVEAGVDVVFGHSSHHPRPIELHRGRPILYGAGDFITDYEGISGHEEFRSDLVPAWFISVEPGAQTAELRIAPFRSRRFRLERPPTADVEWLAATLDEHSRRLGVRVAVGTDGLLVAEPA